MWEKRKKSTRTHTTPTRDLQKKKKKKREEKHETQRKARPTCVCSEKKSLFETHEEEISEGGGPHTQFLVII